MGVSGTTGSGGKTPGPSPAPGPTSTPTPGPTAGGSGIQINVGGPATGSFVAEMDFTGGTATGHRKTVDTSGVRNPAPQKAYQDCLNCNFTYSIPGLKAVAT